MKWGFKSSFLLSSLPMLLASSQDDGGNNRWCNNSPNICLTVEIVDDTTAKFRMEGPKDAGYFAFGLGKNMQGSDIFIASLDKNEPKLEVRQGEGHSVPKLINDTSVNMLQSESLVEDNNLVITFTRPLTSDKGLVSVQSNKNNNFIWAYSGNKSNSGDLSRHTNRGTFDLNVNPKLVGENLEKEKEVGAGEEEIYEEKISVPFLIILHGAMMMIGWIGLPPVAIFIARYLKGVLGVWWFRAHIAVFLLVGVFSLVGLIAISTQLGNVLDNPHAIIGALVLIMYVLQVLLGGVIDRMFNPERKSIPWHDQLHWWLGRSTVGLALINVVSGISMMTASTLWWVGFGFLLLFNYGLFAFGSSRYTPSHHLSEQDLTASKAVNPSYPELVSTTSSQANLITHARTLSSTAPSSNGLPLIQRNGNF